VKGRPRHPQSQGCIKRGNHPFKDALSRWMDENHMNDWTLGAYVGNTRINERAIESHGNQTPCDLMFGKRPKIDDALGNVSSYIQTEQGLLGVTELLQYFRTKLPQFLVGDHDLHILALTCDELHAQQSKLTTPEEIQAFDVDAKRRSRINYISKVYLGYVSDNEDASASAHLHQVIQEHNGHLTTLYGAEVIPQVPERLEVPNDPSNEPDQGDMGDTAMDAEEEGDKGDEMPQKEAEGDEPQKDAEGDEIPEKDAEEGNKIPEKDAEEGDEDQRLGSEEEQDAGTDPLKDGTGLEPPEDNPEFFDAQEDSKGVTEEEKESNKAAAKSNEEFDSDNEECRANKLKMSRKVAVFSQIAR
jgi:hypothetical protein